MLLCCSEEEGLIAWKSMQGEIKVIEAMGREEQTDHGACDGTTNRPAAGQGGNLVRKWRGGDNSSLRHHDILLPQNMFGRAAVHASPPQDNPEE